MNEIMTTSIMERQTNAWEATRVGRRALNIRLHDPDLGPFQDRCSFRAVCPKPSAVY
jgi:hypothetical protein